MATSRIGLDVLLTYPSSVFIMTLLYWQRDYICIVDPSNRICLLYLYVGTLKVFAVLPVHCRSSL